MDRFVVIYMNYRPYFKYNTNIVNNLAEISSAREVIMRSRLVPADDLILKNSAIEKAAHSSTAIEGNPLTPQQVNQLFKGENVVAAEKAKKEVLNYLNVLKNIDNYHKNGKISLKNILEIHKDISNEVLDRPECEGKFRENRVVVSNKIRGTEYHPPRYSEIPELVQSFLKWFNSDLDFHPVIIAGIAHYEFVRIHPFVDGNGRTARALATLILYIKKFDIKRYFALDEYYDVDRNAYELALQSADVTEDLTEWLEYFVKGVLVSILKVKEIVVRLSSEMQRTEDAGQVALTEKQREIVMYLQENGTIANKDIQKMFDITSQAALKIINNMLKDDVIEKEGSGPGTHYILKN